MKKNLEKYKKSIIFYWIIYILVLLITKIIINIFNMEYRQWIYNISLIVIIIGFISGIIQLLLKIKKKIIKIVTIVIFVILMLLISPYTFFFLLFTYEEEDVVMKDDKKMVSYTQTFWDTNIDYYDYINPIVRGKNKKIKENYTENSIYTIIYYDEDGNVIKENTKSYNNSNNINGTEDTTSKETIDISSLFLVGNYNSIYGKINKIEDDKIYFFDKDNTKYQLSNDKKIKYIDGRTGENYSFDDLKLNDYIHADAYYQTCYIFKNIQGEELKKEFLISLSLPDSANMPRASIDEIKDVQQLGNNEAIVTFAISDIISSEYYPDFIDENNTFDIKLKVTNETKYNTIFHGKMAYNANTIENAKSDAMYYIRLNPNTVNNKYPEISEFDSHSN